MRKTLGGLLLAAALAACGPRHASYVKVDNVALGRVVVYRNGVAFYERRATVKGGVLTVSVPRERVDDFLKSLTVVDAFTRKPLPVFMERSILELPEIYVNGGRRGFLVRLKTQDLVRALSPQLVDAAAAG